MNIPKSIKAFSLLTVALAGIPALHAQYDPTFTTSNQVTSFQMWYDSSNTNEQYSPSLIASPTTGMLWVAYVDSGTNALSVASSTDGVNYNVTQQTSQFMNSAPSWGLFGTRILLAFAKDNETISIYQLNESSGTVSDIQDLYIGPLGGGVVARRPGLTSITDTGGVLHLYLSWNGYDYDPGSGQTTGPWVNVIQTINSGIFAPLTEYVTPVSMAYMAGSAPALTTYNGEVYLTYLDATTGYPQMFATTSAGGSTFVDTTGPGGGHGFYGGDPAPVAFEGALYPMFRSAYTDDELWTISTYDGTNFTPAYEYGQTLKYSPSTTVSPAGVLYQAGFTDHPSSGTYMWVQSAPSATTNPNPHTGGGGGGGGGNCSHQDCGY